MTPAENRLLARVADDIGLAAWRFGERGEALASYRRAVYGTDQEPTERGRRERAERLAKGSGVPPAKALRDLTQGERATLCEWIANDVRPQYWDHPVYGRRNRDNYGYECRDGTQWRVDGMGAACSARTLPCAQPVSALEACLSKLREPEHLCEAPPPRECEGLLDTCVPGMISKKPAP
jgi:hypothetical protein